MPLDRKFSWEDHITRSSYFEIETSEPESRHDEKPGLLRAAARHANIRLRQTTGLEIRRVRQPASEAIPEMPEDATFPVSGNLRERRLVGLVEVLTRFFGDLGIAVEPDWIRERVGSYDALFRARPVRDLRHGTGYNNGLVLFCFFSALRPSQVIESGVWRGFSTYLIDNALSDAAQILSFDVNLDMVAWRSERAEYFDRDVTTVDFDVRADTIAFFDDHVSHYDRILYCLRNGIGTIVLDDDVSVETVHSDGWPPVPTANMIMSYDDIPKVFEWRSHGTLFKANIEGLETAGIKERFAYVTMPDLFGTTGYRNSSFLSFLIAQNAAPRTD